MAGASERSAGKIEWPRIQANVYRGVCDGGGIKKYEYIV